MEDYGFIITVLDFAPTGTPNNNTEDDLTPPGGEPLSSSANMSAIFYKFGEKCKLAWEVWVSRFYVKQRILLLVHM